jgi:hypothetical protein
VAGGHRTILIDAWVNALPGAQGLARSVMKLVGHMSEPDDGLTLRHQPSSVTDPAAACGGLLICCVREQLCLHP